MTQSSLVIINDGYMKDALRGIPGYINDVICLTDHAIKGYTCLSSNDSLINKINAGIRLCRSKNIIIVRSYLCRDFIINSLAEKMQMEDGFISMSNVSGFNLTHQFGAHAIHKECFYGLGYLDNTLSDDAWIDYAIRTFLLGFVPKTYDLGLNIQPLAGNIEAWQQKWSGWGPLLSMSENELMKRRAQLIEEYAHEELFMPYCEGSVT